MEMETVRTILREITSLLNFLKIACILKFDKILLYFLLLTEAICKLSQICELLTHYGVQLGNVWEL